MQIEITEKIEVKRTVDIELPYYYERDLSGDYYSCYTYGKIEEDIHTSITVRDGNKFEIEVEKTSWKNHNWLFKNEYRSSEKPYLEAKEELEAAMKLL